MNRNHTRPTKQKTRCCLPSVDLFGALFTLRLAALAPFHIEVDLVGDGMSTAAVTLLSNSELEFVSYTILILSF